MNRRVFVALSSLFVAVMLAGCGGDVPPVTVEPTEVPPTAVLSPTPTLVPTAPPSPTPTDVPLFVGLPADEVDRLREQCLQENPDSLCLPLPFGPASSELVLTEETYQYEQEWPVDFDDPSSEFVTKTVLGSALTVRGGDGITILSPLSGVVDYDRNGDGPGDLRPDRTFYLGFRWDSGLDIGISRPDPQRPHFSLPIADAELTIFAGDPRMMSGTDTVSTGAHVVTVVGEFEARLSWMERPSFSGDDEDIVRTGVWMRDLLRDQYGSIVYIAATVTPPPDQTVVLSDPIEILAMARVSEDTILAECLDVYPTDMSIFEIGVWVSRYQDSLVFEGTGEGATAQNSPMAFALPITGQSRCIVALYVDEEGNASLLYELRSGEVAKLPLPSPGRVEF